MNYVEALDHPEIFGRWFDGPSWVAWRTVEAAIFGLPVPDLDLFKALTGRAEPPDRPASEAWIIAGRRSAKSRKAATVATYLSTIGTEVLGYRQRLAPGERGVVLVMAVDKSQAQGSRSTTPGRISRPFRCSRRWSSATRARLSSSLIACRWWSWRTTSGASGAGRWWRRSSTRSAYWRNEVTSNPDLEVYRAVKPALASCRAGC